jgi:hypothetical protein
MQELKNSKTNPTLIKKPNEQEVFIKEKYSGSHSTLVPAFLN